MIWPIYNDTKTCECGEELDPLEACGCKNYEPENEKESLPDVESIVMRKVYLEAKLKGLEEAITAIRNGMGSINGHKPESFVEKRRKECFAKLRELNDETA